MCHRETTTPVELCAVHCYQSGTSIQSRITGGMGRTASIAGCGAATRLLPSRETANHPGPCNAPSVTRSSWCV